LGASEPATRFGGVSWLTLTERLLENTPALGSASAWDAMRRQLGIKQNLSALEGALDADQLLVAFNAPPAGTHAAAASQQQTAAAVGAHTRGGPGDQLCSDQNWYSYSSRNGSSSGQNGSFSDQNGDCGQKVYSSHNGSSSQNKTKAPGACAPRVAPVAGARSDALHPSAGAINGRAVRGDLHPAGEGARGSSESRAGAGRGYAACRREQDALWASEAVAKGVAHAKRGRAVEALQAYDHALELSPLCVDALVAKGACLVTLARQVSQI
jgi:tetratricopeptide (TPR) repeat protein